MAWYNGDSDDDGGGGLGGFVANPGKAIRKATGFDNSKQKDLMDEAGAVSAEEAGKTRERVQWMESNDRKYQGQVAGYGKDYLNDLDRVKNDMTSQVSDARKTYSNDIQPRMKGIMERAQSEAGSAMSLKDAGDVNNSVQRGVRGLYEDQAQGVQKQATADYGVLSALGSQATQNTMGAGGPMTGAQMQLLNSGNQAQAGIAYQKAQQRVQSLREQGIDKGFQESDRQYQRGQDATDRYGASVGNYESMMDRNNARESGYRDMDMGYASDRFGVQRGLAKENLDVEQGIRNRDLGALGMEYGNRQGMISNQINAANAENASTRGILGGVIQGGMTAAGGYFGGAQGAQAGAAAGGGISNGMQAGAQGGYYQQPQRQSMTR